MLCKDYVPSVLNLLVFNPTSLRADSQWIIILKTFEHVTLSFSQFHFSVIDSVREIAMLFLKPDLRKIEKFFISLFVLLDLLFTASNFIFDLGLNV